MTQKASQKTTLPHSSRALQKLPLPICAAIFADTWRSSSRRGPHVDGPAGGELIRGRDDSDEAIEITSRSFQAGDADLEVVQTYASCALVVMAAIERQHGEVRGLPDQDWSLRVTLVFRREGSEWRQVHRHADPLVHGISLEQASATARGAAPDAQWPNSPAAAATDDQAPTESC